jgi:hypothetical protein
LCHYYFSSHPSGVQVRGTHGNLYHRWTMPDCADVYGLRTKEGALRKRHEILQSIMGYLKQCVLRTLDEKIADSRPCDSNTFSSLTHREGQISVGIQDRSSSVSRLRSNTLVRAQSWVFSDDWETMDGESETGDGTGKLLETDASSSAT